MGKVVNIGERTLRPSTQLSTLLKKAHDAYGDQGVVIRGDAALNYQDLADVLSVCDTAGIRNVRLPVRPRNGSPATSGTSTAANASEASRN